MKTLLSKFPFIIVAFLLPIGCTSSTINVTGAGNRVDTTQAVRFAVSSDDWATGNRPPFHPSVPSASYTSCIRICNRTSVFVAFQMWHPVRGWEGFRIPPGQTGRFGRANAPVHVRWDSAPERGRVIVRKMTLAATRVIGRPPTEYEKNSALVSYFRFTRSGEVGMFRN